MILRYFNVAGADPQLRTGQSTAGATHLIKVAVECALGKRSKIDVFGTDYPTPDGTCMRDYIHVTDLVRAHADALAYLRAGGRPVTLNCGYGHGFSVLEVIETVKRASGVDFRVDLAPRRPGDPARIVAKSDSFAKRSAGGRSSTIFRPSSAMRSPGSARFQWIDANACFHCLIPAGTRFGPTATGACLLSKAAMPIPAGRPWALLGKMEQTSERRNAARYDLAGALYLRPIDSERVRP